RSGLQLDVLGAGPAYTDRPGSAGAAYLLRSAGTAIVLDLGQGAFPRLAAQRRRHLRQPSPSRPLHRPGRAAPLPALAVPATTARARGRARGTRPPPR